MNGELGAVVLNRYAGRGLAKHRLMKTYSWPTSSQSRPSVVPKLGQQSYRGSCRGAA